MDRQSCIDLCVFVLTALDYYKVALIAEYIAVMDSQIHLSCVCLCLS